MSRIIALDCAVTASWAIPDEITGDTQRILADIVARKTSLLVPSLWWYEIMNVLRSSVLRGRLDELAAKKALLFFKELPKEIMGPESQGQSGILAMALENRLSAYNATYAHLALHAGAELFTADEDLLKLRKKYPFIKKPSDY